MAAAVYVRLPSVYPEMLSDDVREVFTAEDGVPYFTDPDSYYHVRLTARLLSHGQLGDARSEDGSAWDTRSYWPEGRSAEYPPGIVWLTAALGRVLGVAAGIPLSAVEYALAPAMAALAAAAAYAVCSRGSRAASSADRKISSAASSVSRQIGGLAAGVLVACSSGFVSRSTFGRFDTDMFVILMDVLLILFLEESLRQNSRRAQFGAAAGFAVTVLVYTLCWTPQNAILFAGLTLCGGLLHVGALFFLRSPAAGSLLQSQTGISPESTSPRRRALRGWLLCAAMTAPVILLRLGPSFAERIFSAVRYTVNVTRAGELPNAFVSVSELNVPRLGPERFLQWFSGYVPGQAVTVVNGVGGLATAAIAAAGLLLACRSGIRFLNNSSDESPDRGTEEDLMTFCILGLLLAGCLYASRRGIRFIEHLGVPTGLLAGSLIGRAAGRPSSGSSSFGTPARQYGKGLLCLVLCLAAAVPALSGSRICSGASRPSFSDISAEGMRWIRENAETPDAVIASWWDAGYFYESETGHPCLWDGGSMSGIRCILMGRALTTPDPALSRAILRMLAGSGDKGILFLMEHADTRTSFEAAWEALPEPKDAAVEILATRCGLTEKEAAEAEALLHPEDPGEIYLVITESMLLRLGWIEYFSDWDFTGTAPLPAASRYDYAPDGHLLADTAEDHSFREIRSRETIWQLYFEKESAGCFFPVYDESDGVERMQIWQVMP